MTVTPGPAIELAEDVLTAAQLNKAVKLLLFAAGAVAVLYALTALQALRAEAAANDATGAALELQAAALGLGQLLADAREQLEASRTTTPPAPPDEPTTTTNQEGSNAA